MIAQKAATLAQEGKDWRRDVTPLPNLLNNQCTPAGWRRGGSHVLRNEDLEGVCNERKAPLLFKSPKPHRPSLPAAASSLRRTRLGSSENHTGASGHRRQLSPAGGARAAGRHPGKTPAGKASLADARVTRTSRRRRLRVPRQAERGPASLAPAARTGPPAPASPAAAGTRHRACAVAASASAWREAPA